MLKLPDIIKAPLSQRLKRLYVSPELLVSWFAHWATPHTFSARGMPEDARLVAAWYDERRHQFCLVVESATFPEVPPGEVLEDFDVVFTEHKPVSDRVSFTAFGRPFLDVVGIDGAKATTTVLR